MAGYFQDQGFSSPDPGMGVGNNAANDFAALNGANPGQFENPFKKHSKQKTVDATMVNPNPAPAPAAVTASNRPPPAISSGPSLIKRVTQNSNPQTALVPGTNMTASEYALAAMKASQPAPPQPAPQIPGPPPLPSYQGIPQFPNPQPPPRVPPSPYGGNQFGGYRPPGMNIPGTSAQSGPQPTSGVAGAVAGPASSLQGLGIPVMGQEPQPMPMMSSATSQGPRRPGMPGYFGGGTVHLMHGGLPQLPGLSGMPTRHFASGGPDGNFVPGDGKGDGRSDHVKAMLSPGEFVMDAESTSLLGNGDSDAGARGMEAIRREIREHKGKALAKGKFSPNAQSPTHLAKVGIKAAQ